VVNATAVAAGDGLTERAACRRLRRLAAQVPAGQTIVELGAYKGRTTAWLALGASEGDGATVVSVDPWDLRADDDWPAGYAQVEPAYATGVYSQSGTFTAYRDHLRACGALMRVWTVRGFAAEVGHGWQGQPVGLLWHDAEHTADAVADDLTAWLPHLAPGAVVALHDAGNPLMGVMAGAKRVLNNPDFDWRHRKLYRWRKDPTRRGMLVVRKR